MGEEVDLFCYEDMALSPLQTESQAPAFSTNITSSSQKVGKSPTKMHSPDSTSSYPDSEKNPIGRRARLQRKGPKMSVDSPNSTIDSDNVHRKRKRNNHVCNSQCLAYAWDDLELGESLGSTAYNQYLNQVSGSSANSQSTLSLTPAQLYEIVDTINPKYVPPPHSSFLTYFNSKGRNECKHKLLHNSNGDKDNVFTLNGKDKFSEAYERLREQNGDDEVATRRRIHFSTSDAVRKKIRCTETKICELTLREEKVMKTARTLGLFNLKCDSS